MDYNRDVQNAMRKNLVFRNVMFNDNKCSFVSSTETFQCESWSCAQVLEWLEGCFFN